jgi:hypothetical protein
MALAVGDGDDPAEWYYGHGGECRPTISSTLSTQLALRPSFPDMMHSPRVYTATV